MTVQKNAPLVSVIIPAYNHENYVTQCLDSVLDEEYPNKEIVVINDGSTDRTLQRIEEWARNHAEVISVTIRSQPNKGISAAFNHALTLVKGDFIVPIASDDMLLSGGIRQRINYLCEHPDLLAVFGDCITIDESGRKIHESCLRDFHHTDTRWYETLTKTALRVIWRWGIPGPVLLARKTLYQTIGGYDEERRVEDWDIFLRMVAARALGFVNAPVSAYRLHTANSCRMPERRSFIWSELAKRRVQTRPVVQESCLAHSRLS